MQPGESSASVGERVKRARATQYARLGSGQVNARMNSSDIERYARPDEEGARLIDRAMNHFSLSARSYHRILKIARTIADQAGSEGVNATHVAEALQYRGEDLLNAP